MCLITKQTKPTILKEDMTVYKKFKLIDGVLNSYIQEFTWELNKLYQTTIEESFDFVFNDLISKRESMISCNVRESMIHELTSIQISYIAQQNNLKSYGPGFHSADKKRRLIISTYNSVAHVLCECTIPAGSEIYTDTTGLIVSNQIIINKLCA